MFSIPKGTVEESSPSFFITKRDKRLLELFLSVSGTFWFQDALGDNLDNDLDATELFRILQEEEQT